MSAALRRLLPLPNVVPRPAHNDRGAMDARTSAPSTRPRRRRPLAAAPSAGSPPPPAHSTTKRPTPNADRPQKGGPCADSRGRDKRHATRADGTAAVAASAQREGSPLACATPASRPATLPTRRHRRREDPNPAAVPAALAGHFRCHRALVRCAGIPSSEGTRAMSTTAAAVGGHPLLLLLERCCCSSCSCMPLRAVGYAPGSRSSVASPQRRWSAYHRPNLTSHRPRSVGS